jgi:hypothetical protein
MITHEVSAPQGDILTSDKQVNLFLGGVGSGKTHLAAYIAYLYIQRFPQCIGFIAANTYDQLDKSTMFRIRQVWRDMELTEFSDENKRGVYVVGKRPPGHFKKVYDFDSYHSVVSWVNGGVILLGSLDNAKSHEGKELAWAILDETKDTREQDVKDVILARMRQKGMFILDGQITDDPSGEPFNPVYFTTSPAKVAWLNEMFELEADIAEIEAKIYSDKTYFKKEFGNKFVTISSTYHNLDNLPKNYIDNYKQNNSEERIKALIYANPFSSSGGEFYSSFSRLNHVGPVVYDPSLPLHVSFDQNTVPYSSALACQVSKRGDIWQVGAVGEVTLANPHNSTEEVCEEVLRRWGDCKFIFYYGDASGKNRSTLDKAVKHHYQVVERVLSVKLTNGSNRVLKKNPGLLARREFINKLFEQKLPIRIAIDPSCAKLNADLTYIKQDVDGGKKKEIEKDKDTGERYEKFGHLSDCLDYFLCSAFSDYFIK